MGEAGSRSYLTDVSDEEWVFVLPYLLLSREDTRSHRHELRALFHGVRSIVKTGNPWCMMPHDLPPWPAVYQQMRRWMRAGCFELLVEDAQGLPREFAGRGGPADGGDHRQWHTAVHAGVRCEAAHKGSKVHIAVDTLGHLMALTITPADAGDRAQITELAEQLHEATGSTASGLK